MRNNIKAILLFGLFCGASPFLVGCSKKSKQKLMPAGSPMSAYIRFEYAVYMMPVHAKDPRVVLQQALVEKFTKLKLADELPKAPREVVVKSRTEEDVQREYAPPERENKPRPEAKRIPPPECPE
jgi:hypothetical protein